MHSSDTTDLIEQKLDELRTELMIIISSSRDQKEISDKIFEVMAKYPAMQEIPNLIASLNNIISTDLKNLKDTLIKTMDTLISIKKMAIKQQKVLEIALHDLQEDFQQFGKDFESLKKNLGITDEFQVSNKDKQSSENLNGVVQIFGQKIPLFHLVISVILIVSMIFGMFVLNPTAAKQTTETLGVASDKINEHQK